MTTLNLTLEGFIELSGVEANDYRAVNNNHWSGYVPEFLEIGQGARVLRYVPLLKRYVFLRKKLFHLVAEHSPVLRINNDALHLLSPPIGFVPPAIRPRTAFLAPLITSRTGPLE